MTDPAPTLASDSKTWAIIAHVGPLVGFGFIVPLVVYLIKKGEDPFVEHHGREALNFQITLLIGFVISAVLIIVIIGIFMLIAVGIAAVVFAIIAAVKASNGELYEYPLSIRLVK